MGTKPDVAKSTMRKKLCVERFLKSASCELPPAEPNKSATGRDLRRMEKILINVGRSSMGGMELTVKGLRIELQNTIKIYTNTLQKYKKS